MGQPTHFMIEGLDRLGKDTLIEGIQHRYGYHQVLHYRKPLNLRCYSQDDPRAGMRRYQEDSFRTMFRFLRDNSHEKLICNRAHLGECVYAPLYRGYSGEYVFDIEKEFKAHQLTHVRLILLVWDFTVEDRSVDDGKSLGNRADREPEQKLFLNAFSASEIVDKRIVCVTDKVRQAFKFPETILEEVLA